ncbi:MAG: DUF309 domain-containing protein [Dehalococcoidia bacterium]
MSDEGRISAHEGPRVRPRIGKVRRGEHSERCGEPPSPALVQGIAEFNRGEFFEQHETLEAAWIEEDDPIRYLYQGILQIGVGFHHLSRGNSYGARRLWTRGMALLESFRPACMDIDVERLVHETRRCLDELDRIGVTGDGEFDQSLIPQVHRLSR